MNAVRRGIRNAFRNATRSVSVIVILAVAIALSISMLIARDAVTSKINSVRASTGTTITIAPKGFFGFTGGGTPLTTKEINPLIDLANVKAIQESLSEEATTSDTSLKIPVPSGALTNRFGSSSGGGFGGSTSGRTFTIPLRVIGTNSPGNAVTGGAAGGGTEKLTQGTSFSATSKSDVAIVGATLASTNKLKVGSTFTLWKTKVSVIGIYNAGSTFADSDLLMPLASVQTLAKVSGQLTGATVTVNTVNNVASVDKIIAKKLSKVADVTSTQAAVQSELAPLNSVKTISTYTLGGAIVAAAIILLLSMLMIVRERRREIGVLKALGGPNRSIVGQFIAESTTFTVLGAVVGFLVGVLISSPITSALVSATGGNSTGPSNFGGFVRGSGGAIAGGGSGFTPPTGAGGGGFAFRIGGFHNTLTTLHTSAGWSTLIFAFLIAIVIAALGSTVATATVVRIRPAEVLRSE